MSACGRGGAQADEQLEPFRIREPQATFTPTVLTDDGSAGANNTGQVPAQSEAQAGTTADDSNNDSGSENNTATTGSATEDAAAPEQAAEADPNYAGSQAVITSAIVNGRSGPGTDYEVVGLVVDGETFGVLGQNDAGDWWHLCCYLDQEFWVVNNFIEIRELATGAIQAAAAPTQIPAAPPTATPVPPAAAPAPAATAEPTAPPAEAPAAAPATSDLPFELALQEQFPETSVVRIFLYVFNSDVAALEGYSLKVTKDGNEIPVGSKSYGPQPGFTWPIATTRQRFENMKVEFPGESPAGIWVVELVDGSGKIVGPPSTFELSGNDPDRELYVRYEQR